MLETLVSSRIRRTLFEHILTHSTDRFYLRGLAKDLGLSISPLRRELKRLESSGLLKGEQEGNIVFYTVNTASPLFLQLQHASLSTTTAATQTAEAPSSEFGIRSSEFGVAAHSPEPTLRQTLRGPLSGPVLLGAASVGLALVLLVAGLVYLNMTNQKLVTQAARALAQRKSEVTVVMPQSAASGAMRGSRWQVVPGGFGGFSTGGSEETY